MNGSEDLTPLNKQELIKQIGDSRNDALVCVSLLRYINDEEIYRAFRKRPLRIGTYSDDKPGFVHD